MVVEPLQRAVEVCETIETEVEVEAAAEVEMEPWPRRAFELPKRIVVTSSFFKLKVFSIFFNSP